jgi:hypothetical protein
VRIGGEKKFARATPPWNRSGAAHAHVGPVKRPRQGDGGPKSATSGSGGAASGHERVKAAIAEDVGRPLFVHARRRAAVAGNRSRTPTSLALRSLTPSLPPIARPSPGHRQAIRPSPRTFFAYARGLARNLRLMIGRVFGRIAQGRWRGRAGGGAGGRPLLFDFG